ncbi:type IV pili methyl-accepting chemotaxis transducer N-terminal domain-containing protein [Cellulophaga sp. E16_2]|uniref:type IV pili methyl-accepting chemotaxis transducer N-terminal domain-containing protein n=1 Tax=Cellulophaga sp. E16_2 TaxID=2789297 RepID=UPI001A9267DC|nr:type IV pili methyl-accepting chemotaxis transducer N-terminal domain-containing protein [Cellulophaga sp. E16_2]
MKKFYKYYLLVSTIIILTVLIQSIIQYSLRNQERMAAVINVAGKQRMFSQLVLKDFYECKDYDCNYSELKVALAKLYRTDEVLQNGDEKLGFYAVENPEIIADFKKLQPHLDYIYANLNATDRIAEVSVIELSDHVDSFLKIMDSIVLKFQQESEEEIKTIMIIEVELAVLSLFIILFEIVYIVNPIIRKTTSQNQKLKEISWHQSHAYASHMKNIKDLQHVLKIERKIENKEDLVACVITELDALNEVSENMLKSLESDEEEISKLDILLTKLDKLFDRKK